MQGLLLLNKPAGITSFGAVARVKRIAKEKRVGHTGTLDPMATGVLPVLLGRATALSSLMLDADKRYTAQIRLGIATDTEDITGKILCERPVSVTEKQITDVLAGFCGEQKQRPPMFSALKKDGVRLYELARKGERLTLPERDITVYRAQLMRYGEETHTVCVDFHVSKGTYIRSLARDIGEALGCGACLQALTRTYAGGFRLEDCVSLDNMSEENLSEVLLPEETAVGHLRELFVTEKQAIRFGNGGPLSLERLENTDFSPDELFRVKWQDCFLGVGRANTEAGQLEIQCIINQVRKAEC